MASPTKPQPTRTLPTSRSAQNSEPKEPDVTVFNLGSIIKNSSYRKTIWDKVKDEAAHPIHHGIRMQAHHLISAAALASLPDNFKKNIEYFNYEINCIENLVFLPCTLPGACHLQVQPHRGDHKFHIDDPMGPPEDDRKIEISYHQIIASRLRRLKPLTKKSCIGECTPKELSRISKEARAIFFSLSEEILYDIQNHPSNAPLTKAFDHFHSKSNIGCSGFTSLEDYKPAPCPENRDHAIKKSSLIKFKKPKFYNLTIGK